MRRSFDYRVDKMGLTAQVYLRIRPVDPITVPRGILLTPDPVGASLTVSGAGLGKGLG